MLQLRVKLFKVPILRAFKNIALKFLTLIFYTPSHYSSDTKKIIQEILRGNKNLLKFFQSNEIKEKHILSILSSIDEEFFSELIDEIKGLDELKKGKGKKVATFFSLSYKGKPVSAYFKQIFENRISVK